MDFKKIANEAVGNIEKATLSFPKYFYKNMSDGEIYENNFCFTVQYNPKSLKMESKCEKDDVMSDGGIKIERILPETTLSFELIFNQVNNQDAFIGEKFSASPGSLISTASALSSQLGETPIYSVKDYVETLLDCAAYPLTTWIEFRWGNMVFRGELQSVNASYTMFNFQGEPICASVHMQIQDRAEVMLNNQDNDYWEQALAKFLGADDSSSDISSQSPLDSLSAVLNL